VQNRAFTLAEVLITLGIIGVLAAILIPLLISKIQHRQNISALKKAYSILQQAENNIYVDYGMNSVFLCSTNDSYCLGDIYKQYLKILKYDKYIPNSDPEICFGANAVILNSTENHYCITTVDGIIFDFDMEFSSNSSHTALINVDINGIKKPNLFGKDRYIFRIKENKVVPYYNERWDCKNGKGTSYYNYNCAYVYLNQNGLK